MKCYRCDLRALIFILSLTGIKNCKSTEKSSEPLHETTEEHSKAVNILDSTQPVDTLPLELSRIKSGLGNLEENIAQVLAESNTLSVHNAASVSLTVPSPADRENASLEPGCQGRCPSENKKSMESYKEIPFITCVDSDIVGENERILLTLVYNSKTKMVTNWRIYGLNDPRRSGGVVYEFYYSQEKNEYEIETQSSLGFENWFAISLNETWFLNKITIGGIKNGTENPFQMRLIFSEKNDVKLASKKSVSLSHCLFSLNWRLRHEK